MGDGAGWESGQRAAGQLAGAALVQAQVWSCSFLIGPPRRHAGIAATHSLTIHKPLHHHPP